MDQELKTHIITYSPEETLEYGKKLGEALPKNSVLCFFGDLGAGKTTLIKGIVSGATGTHSDEVCSPTFVYLNIYEGSKSIYHFDLYRLKDETDFLSMGFDEYFYADGICCLEWSERIEKIIPKNYYRVELTHCGGTKREINFIPSKGLGL